MQKLGERIRHVRGKMSQEAFAGLLGISKGALGGYERGENCPNVDVILTICKQCKISVEWLMSGVGGMSVEGLAADGFGSGIHLPGSDGGKNAMDGKMALQDGSSAGQTDAFSDTALREHCRWLQERLERLEEERRDLNRENRLLWQKNADLGTRLARLEQVLERKESDAAVAAVRNGPALRACGQRPHGLQESRKAYPGE